LRGSLPKSDSSAAIRTSQLSDWASEPDSHCETNTSTLPRMRRREEESIKQIRRGVRRFRGVIFPKMRSLYESLAEKQKPHTLFITCGDSRIEPSLLTGTKPGQIFVERTPGNIIPPYDETASVGVSASIEYAVAELGVKHIIVCGHSACGAMKALLDPNALDELPATRRWLQYAHSALEQLNRSDSPDNEPNRPDRLAQLNVIEQIAHLHSHPAVQQRFTQDVVQIHGWFYEIHTGTVQVFDPKSASSHWLAAG